ncbi:unnamed protein product [Brugia timori]|uniref:I/LWEQ domain-containing protein n=1 Tax=Brugia timori TaxID=42155 RepID=A0A0R3R2J3_9BILA|nr:unnamed protein product [Brugia timori]
MKQIIRPCRILWNLQQQRNMLMLTSDISVIRTIALSTSYASLEENRRQLDERLRSLNDSEALKEARRKFELIEKETLKSSQVIQNKINDVRNHISQMIVEVQKTEAGKKLSLAAEEVLKQAKVAAEMIEKAAEQVGDNQLYQSVSSSVKVIKDEVDNIVDVHMYTRPDQLKMRSASSSTYTDRVIEANP